MKERVLDFLHGISKGEHEVIPWLAEELNVPEDAVVIRARKTLKYLLHHYGYFNITTIDTFFYRVVRSFSREIGLQGTFQVELDSEKVTDRLVDTLLQEVTDDAQLKNWLIDFSMDRLSDGKGYEFRREVKQLGKQLFSEQFKQLPDGLLVSGDRKEEIKKMKAALHQRNRAFENALKKHADNFFTVLGEAGVAPADLKGGARSAIVGFFRKLQTGRYKDLINKSILLAQESAEAWVSKTNGDKVRIASLASERLMPILNDAIGQYEKEHRQYFTSLAVLKNFYTLGLLTDLSGKLQQYRQEEEAIMISDLPDFLSRIIRDSDAPFIYEKVGSRYAHFLIDEFQDTSAFQWNNFRPLLEESLANGNESLIVGDAKQSIYGFRGGDPSLLIDGVREAFPVTKEKQLAHNYRSCEHIVAFNNELFGALPSLLVDLATERLSAEGAARILSAYEEAEQQVAKKGQDKGCVQLQFLKAEKEENWKQLAARRTISLVEQLQHDGCPPGDIAIVVRANSEARLLVQAFFEHKNRGSSEEKLSYEVVSADGMLLINAPVVRLMIAAMRYLQNPKDTVLELELAHRVSEMRGFEGENGHACFSKLGKDSLPPAFVKHREQLMHLPVYELTEVLVRLFRLEQSKGEYAYLQAFQDEVLAFSKKNKTETGSFLLWWEERNKPDRKPSVQLAEGSSAIEIITVHKSKGLQYPVVIVPFCNFSMDNQRHISWYRSPEGEVFDALGAVPVEYTSGLEETLLQPDYQKESAQWFLEHLNMLYVTFTRAEKGLYVFCEASGSSSRTGYSDVSKLLLNYFEQKLPEGWDAASQCFNAGRLPASEESVASAHVHLEKYPSFKWSDRLAVRKDSTEKDKEEGDQRSTGILLHQVLSEVIHWQDTSQVLEKYVASGRLSRQDGVRFSSIFETLWKDERIRSWFEGNSEVKTEVVVLPGSGEIRRMDRVLVDGDEATIIDFKSGKPRAADKKQLEEYKSLLQEMGYEVNAFLLYLESASVISL